MKKEIFSHSKILLLCSLVLGFFANQFVFAQCGNYFKTNYRALDKLKYTLNNTFLLDDWTGDGKLDYWSFQLNSATSTQNIVIYPAKASGYWDFNNPIVYATGISSSFRMISNNPTTYDVKDFNGDGRIDLLVGTTTGSFLNRNNGNGTLTTLTQFPYPASFLSSLGFYDINGDKLLDWITIVGVPGQGNSLGYQLGNSIGTFDSRVDLVTSIPLTQAAKAVGDFDGDGKIDIFYSQNSTDNPVYINLKNSGAGNFESKISASLGGFSSMGLLDTADFNNDGRTDILAYSGAAGARNFFILFGQTDGTFTKTNYDVYSPNKYASVKIADFNGDGKLDLVEIGEDFYSIHTNNGGTFTRTDYNQTLLNQPNGVKFSDFNGDNKADFVDISNPIFNVFGENVLIVKENVCQPFGQTHTQDFNGDLTGDVTYWNSASGRWTYFKADWYNPGNSVSFNWGNGALGDVPVAGDFDGDGKTDYAVYRNSNGYWYIYKSSDSSWLSFQFGLTGDVPVPNDYNGGGKTDIAVFRPETGVWYFLYLENQQFSAVQFGLKNDKTVPADYDGDGKTDVAVFRPDTAVWYYLRSSDNSFVALQWGISTDKPVPADFDGDGRADITVYRNGIWYVLRSSNNAFAAINWGTATDTPVPFYRNPDIADFVVLRPSNGVLYNLIYPTQGLNFNAVQNVLVTTTLTKN